MKRLWLLVVAVVAWAGVAQAQPTVRGVGAVAASLQSALSAIDAGPAQTGDLMFLACESDELITTPSGWTSVTGSPSVRTSAPAARVSVFYRVAVAADVDGQCEACSVARPADPGNHLLCAILSVAGADTASPFDVSEASNGGGAAATTITGDTATVTTSLVVVVVGKADNKDSDPQFTSWANSASPGGCTSLGSLTGQISGSTTLGNDGALGVATGTLATATRWCDTTVTGPTAGSAHLAFNVKVAPAGTPTNTQTPTATETNTPTVTNTVPTPTVTATYTVTATRTNTATPTVTATGTITNTATRTATRTNTPTVTNTPSGCDKQDANGTRWRPGRCTGPEDEFAVILAKKTPGGTAFRSDSVPRPFNEFYDANGVRIGTGTSPHQLGIDATLTSSLSSRLIQTGRNASDVPSYTPANVDDWGAVAKAINATITALFNFTDELPERDSVPFQVFTTHRFRCGPVPLNETSYYCTLGGGGPTLDPDAGQSMASDDCAVVSASLTTYADADTREGVPAGCILSAVLVVDGVALTPLSALNGDATPPLDGAAQYDLSEAAGWAVGDLRGVLLGTAGAGCTDDVGLIVEGEIRCGGVQP